MTILGYLFGLPQQLFDSAVVPGDLPEKAPTSTANWRESGATCLTCGIGVNGPGFANAAEQRQHFKTDWHRYNVKRRLAKQPPVSEDAFEKVLEQGTEVSISGSGSDTSDEEDEEADAGEAGGESLPRRQKGHAQARNAPAGNTAKHDADGLEGFDVVVHKTFHRYVVRAKAGGKQSSKDATGKFARSAGSRLRRYNEVALERDVQELLASWADHLASADLIFVHAPASNARSLFKEEQTTLLQSNPRLRRVPFVTHRPTFSETKRVLRLLTAVFRPELAEQLLATQHSEHAAEEAEAVAAAAEALAGAQLNTAPQPPSQEGHSGRPAQQEPEEADGEADAGPSASSAAARQQPAGPSEAPLHKAAKAGDPERVKRLLESGHDPCARDAKGRTPYALAADKHTRDAFRRFMGQHPDRWDYAAAGIPSALTEEMEAAQQAKKAAHKTKLKGKEAERKPGKGDGAGGSAEEQRKAVAAAAEAARLQALDDEIAQAAAEAATMAARLNASAKPSASSGRAGGNKVGGGAGGAKAGKASGAKGGAAAQPAAAPTPEELARRRDMMAAAAEARMRALTQASQQQKLW
ncbi:hypothetical protein GPECTOR_1g270 [Gonium pectorale]|uniref:VLRF1 domain-containing protein n=1 Tax=Gonium pectorale TaxID=33097 RepID=A0A150H2C3_GONPE|nr:hypothetical protein GPECTOR_1g270 [Gonium pectorale]|eukprot:KXZ56307.1 hypothetical protein GPECTOR_1g270 [Gonium pectorale]